MPSPIQIAVSNTKKRPRKGVADCCVAYYIYNAYEHLVSYDCDGKKITSQMVEFEDVRNKLLDARELIRATMDMLNKMDLTENTENYKDKILESVIKKQNTEGQKIHAYFLVWACLAALRFVFDHRLVRLRLELDCKVLRKKSIPTWVIPLPRLP